jgi:general secretion pathway protein E
VVVVPAAASAQAASHRSAVAPTTGAAGDEQEETTGWATDLDEAPSETPSEPSPTGRFYRWVTGRRPAEAEGPGEIITPVPRPGLVLDFRRAQKVKSERLQVLLVRLAALVVVVFAVVMVFAQGYAILSGMAAEGAGAHFSRLFGGQAGGFALVAFLRSALLIVISLVLIVSGTGTLLFRRGSRRVLMGALVALVLVCLAHIGVINHPSFSPEEFDADLLVVREVIYVMAAGAVVVLLAQYARLFDVRFTDESPNIMAVVDRVISEALRVRASDIHIEPGSEGVAIRYRIDGLLHTVATCPEQALDRIVARVKVIGEMDIAERRLPQDGGATFHLSDRDVDMRISTVPSSFGERAVIRLLDRATGLLGLEGLGLGPELVRVLNRIVRSPYGVFFSTGPTGSGKTTTLYAALMKVDSAERNVITVEDPVEYQLPGITQLPVRKKKGMTFASGLRSILRQDPDVLMVGEVRDEETAHIVIEASQTGHMVFTTLHTNDSAGAIARLLDLGVEPFLLASCLTAVLAQRLVRRVCANCKESYLAPLRECKVAGLNREDNPVLYRGKGCEACMGTGYRGRTGLFELLVVDDTIRDLITERANAMTIRKCALEHGMVALRHDGVRKMLAGITTLEEVERATQTSVLPT